MAKEIELGLVLTGQDAIDFWRYQENPEYTPRVKEMLKRAYEMAMARDEQE